ncbi:hypothetical protein KSS87_012775, partial [Heliosperma pusillum]
LVEKILRIQPNVRKLYLLVRAKDSESANVRIHDEVLGKELFRILKETWGENFDSFISEKITPVAGDTSYEDLGLVDDDLKTQIFKDVDIVVNVAATTKFDERYVSTIILLTIFLYYLLRPRASAKWLIVIYCF